MDSAPSLAPASRVRQDFDRLAVLLDDRWDHNSQYHDFLLRHVPEPCGRALEIGCGTGVFSRLLATRAQSVLGFDLSPNMVRLARERSEGIANLEYRVEDVTMSKLPRAHFDCIASIATLHHLAFEATLAQLREALRPGGVLLVLDVVRSAGLTGLLCDMAAVPANLLLHRLRTGAFRDPPVVRRAWQEHGRTDVYLALPEVRAGCARVLRGAAVRRHLLWRYSIVWRRPAVGAP